MKESRYNFFFEVDKKHFVFNSLTCALAHIDDSFKENMKRAINGEDINTKLLHDMKKSGVLVEDSFDELDYLRVIHMQVKFQERSLGMIIAPTLMCNFACPYCYETPQATFMNDEVMNAIVERVKDATERKLPVKITWYGGEPLLAKDVIWKLSKDMIDICEKNGANYRAMMISNGYLVDDNVIENMIAYKINHVQVTVDGTPDIHNARRKLKNSNEPTFDRIMMNVKKMTDAGIHVSIRINVDKTNVERVNELIPELKKYRFKNCYIYLGKVTDSTDVIEHIADTCLDMPEYSSEFNNWTRVLMENAVMPDIKPIYPSFKNSFCTADCLSIFVVDPNGNMYKCLHDVGDLSKKVGNIVEQKDNIKSIEQQEQFSFHSNYLLWSPFNFQKCRECKILPLCMGGCTSAGIRASEPICEPLKYNLIDSLKLWVTSKNLSNK